jgi:hypothetical protein
MNTNLHDWAGSLLATSIIYEKADTVPQPANAVQLAATGPGGFPLMSAPWNGAVAADLSTNEGFLAAVGWPAGGPTSPSRGSSLGEREADKTTIQAVVRLPSNPFQLEGNASYVVTDADRALLEHLLAPGTTECLYDAFIVPHLAEIGVSVEAATAASDAAAAKEQAELAEWWKEHQDQPAPPGLALDPGVLRLHGQYGRFHAAVGSWETTDGRKGTGVAIPFSDDTGHFWFFAPGNIEITVSVLKDPLPDGREADWVKWHGATNVGFTLTVIDTKTGRSWQHTNPVGNLVGVVDTAAFPAV